MRRDTYSGGTQHGMLLTWIAAYQRRQKFKRNRVYCPVDTCGTTPLNQHSERQLLVS
jgi:hypothetical protein